MHAWAKYGLLGGHVALQFVNTVDDEGKTRDQDGIPDWDTALDWARTAELLSDDEAGTLPRRADTPAAREELAALHRLRETAWRVLRGAAADAPADADDLEALGAAIAWATRAAALWRDGREFRWVLDGEALGAALLRARLALALSDLMLHTDLQRLRECGRCTALYLDHGRGVGRRWCRMATCGNRAKVERYRSKR